MYQKVFQHFFAHEYEKDTTLMFLLAFKYLVMIACLIDQQKGSMQVGTLSMAVPVVEFSRGGY